MLIDVSEVRAASIALMMEAAHTSEMSADIKLRTQLYIPEDSELLNIRNVYTRTFSDTRTCSSK
jgi:hypothetical protein